MKKLNKKMKIEEMLNRASSCKIEQDADSFLGDFIQLFEASCFGSFIQANAESYIEEGNLYCSVEFNHVISDQFITCIRPLIRAGEFVITVETNRMIDELGMSSKKWEIHNDLAVGFTGKREFAIETIQIEAFRKAQKDWRYILQSAGLSCDQALKESEQLSGGNNEKDKVDKVSHEGLKEIINKWSKIETTKPTNQPGFIDGFINFLNTTSDDRDVSFNGDGSYFGKQVTIEKNSGVCIADPVLSFEIAYTANKIVVYTARHEGFWTPAYLEMNSDHADFRRVIKALTKILNKASGLGELNSL